MLNFLKLFFLFIIIFSIQNTYSDEQVSASIISPLAKHSLLLQSDRHKLLTIVIGERGHILYSNNNEDWNQALVETNKTLTNVFMLNEQTAWTVGHDAVILKSIDGAANWKKLFSAINEEAPLLDIYFKDELNGIAIGAYSLMYLTNDGGLNWRKSELNLIKDNNSDHSDFFDFHLNDIAYAGNDRFYIAAESGHILRSDDNAKSWLRLDSPYSGSFFGVLPLSFNEVIAYGLRGHLYRSNDAGQSWEKIETNSKQMLTDATVLSNGNILVAGLGGTLLHSNDNGRTFSTIELSHRHNLSSVLETENGSVLLTGDAGIQLLPENYFISE